MTRPTKIPAVAIIGYSGAGKTTLIERLIPILMKKGWKVGTLKHDAHQFDVDHPGKDTYRHREAGAAAVMITSEARLALMVEQPKSLPIERLVDLLAEQGVDAVLIEGYKQTELPKVAVIRREEDLTLLSRNSGIRLSAAGVRLDPTRIASETGIQCVSLDDVESLAKWIDQLWRDFNSEPL